jgi:hypothetical protein
LPIFLIVDFALQVESDGTLAVEVTSGGTPSPTLTPAPSMTRSPTTMPSEALLCRTVVLAGPYDGSNSGFLKEYTADGKVKEDSRLLF